MIAVNGQSVLDRGVQATIQLIGASHRPLTLTFQDPSAVDKSIADKIKRAERGEVSPVLPHAP